MNGIVLWYKRDKKIGLVWCDDQGPLACITSDALVRSGFDHLEAGDQILCDVRDAGGMREVCRILSHRPCSSALDVQVLLRAEADKTAQLGGAGDAPVSDQAEPDTPTAINQKPQDGGVRPIPQSGGQLRVVA